MAQLKLSQSNLNRIKVPVPPLADQKRFIDKIKALERAIADVQAIIDAAAAKKQAVIQRYLRGTTE